MKHQDIPRSLKPSTLSKITTYFALIVILLYSLGPIYWLVVSSTKSNADLLSSSGWWFADLNIVQNYNILIDWTQGYFWRWVGNSVLYSTVAGALGTLISVMAGYGLAKYTFPGRAAIQITIAAGLLMPIVLLTIPLYFVLDAVNLLNTMWAIVLPSCVSPFGVFLGIVYSHTSVPDELIEAARIDGAGEIRIFFTMVLRLLAPAMVTIFLFIFVATWNNFLLPLLTMTDAPKKPITLGLYGMMSYFRPTYGAVLQGALLGVIPLIILFLVLQRYWQSGLAAGSVKG